MADKKTWLVVADGIDDRAVTGALVKAGYSVEHVELDAAQSVADSHLSQLTTQGTVVLRKCSVDSSCEIEDTNRALFAAIPDLVFRISRDYKFICTNKDHDDAFYVPPSEFIGEDLYSVLPPDMADLTAKKIDQVLETGQACVFDYCLELASNKRYFECRMAPCGDDVIAVSREVTEHIYAEREQRIRADVLRAINTIQHAPDLARELTTLIKDFSGCEAVGIRIQDGDDYPYWETQGFSDEFIRTEKYIRAYDKDGEPIRDSEGNSAIECLCGSVIRGSLDPSLPFLTQFGSFWVNNSDQLLSITNLDDFSTTLRGKCLGEGYESLALVPLKVAEKCIGLLQFNDHRPGCFTAERIKVFESIAESMAISLAHRRASEALRKSQASLINAQSLVHMGSYEFDLSDGSGSFSSESLRILGLDESAGNLTLLDSYDLIHPDDREKVYQIYTDFVGSRASDTFDIEYRVVLADGTIKYVHSVAQATCDASGKATALFGTITDITERKLTEDALAKAREELEKAYKREHHIADVLQRALIPEVDLRRDEYSVLATYLPALDEAEVGGDFYDVFSLRDGRLALIMGDVSGKGLTAAVHTAMVKYTLQAYAHEDPSPSTVLERLNRTIYDAALEDLFITVFYGVLDTSANVLTYANGGHDLPLHFAKVQGKTIPLDVTGRAIGFLRDSTYQERNHKLADGDTLIIYTDGITDARSRGHFFGIEGLSEVVTTNAQATNHELVKAVLKAALDASQGKLHDDCAMLVIKREISES